MTRIHDLLTEHTTTSFEFFPPKTDAGRERLEATIDELEPLGASFVSVTYGAGGSTRELTHEVVMHVLEETSLLPMAHLTTVMHTHDEVAAILTRYLDAGVRNLMALRGDPPDETHGEPFHAFPHAVDLVSLAREIGGEAFSIGVAAHPEGHPSASDLESDRRHLAAKLAIADFAVTQFFFDIEPYLRLVEDLAALDCHKPVIPGIMPVTNVRQIQRFAELSGAAFPSWLAQRLHAAEDDPTEVERIGVEVATELCERLLDIGAPGLHFYTLNRSTATRRIHANLAGRLPTGA